MTRTALVALAQVVLMLLLAVLVAMPLKAQNPWDGVLKGGTALKTFHERVCSSGPAG